MRHDSPTMLLYCPVAQQELDAIAAAHWVALPVGLLRQPAFYFTPEEATTAYYTQASTTDTGYLVRFASDAEYAAAFPTHSPKNGPTSMRVPAEEMVEFNYHIMGQIEVVAVL
ncbi:hypothetical protein H8B15_19565 [Hymenobacter sp. BT507]|uniref:Uncharacterized protein n=1 Tax=Hymenobacter citatus TaxID=2763506 RepID=A0ABR7MPX6_9BACT|nr:hypothetical protein [Hymenobacter citatus]MBC6613131.1 hypothetical protein [Hymenobacter citatus]